MKSRMIKCLVAVLVLAMMLQVPLALTSSASTLSEATSIRFVLSKVKASNAPAGSNAEVNLYASTDPNAKVTTLGATLVLDLDMFDIIDRSGTVVTDDYKVESRQVGAAFPLNANAFDDEEGLESMDSCSLASYNANTNRLYLFIAGMNANGVSVANNSKIATFFLKIKPEADGWVPEPTENDIRVMSAEEYRAADKTETCPTDSIPSAEISSKGVVFTPAAEDLVSAFTLSVNYLTTGGIDGMNAFDVTNEKASITVDLVNEANEIVQTLTTTEPEGFEFIKVKPGTYSVRYSALGCLGFTIHHVEVEEESVAELPPLKLIFGDFNTNLQIDLDDLSQMISLASNLDFNPLADTDGNDIIELSDITDTIYYYGTLAEEQVMSLSETIE